MRRFAVGVVATLALALLAAGCGTKQERIAPRGSGALSVMLDFYPNADHVGLYTGIEQGEFRRAGLDVRVQTPGDPSAPLKLLAAGKVDLAISYEPELLLARDRGAPLVAVGAIVQRPLTSVIAIGGSKVKRIGDLGGKTVGTAGIPYQDAELRTIEQRAGVSGVKSVNVGFNLLPAMLSKRVDATLGGFWNYEGIQLRQQGKKPTVIPVDRAGVPTYDELVLVARRDTLRDHGQLVRRFVQALGRGYADVRANPARGVEDLVRSVPGLAKSRRLEQASVRATLPSFFPANTDEPFGYQDRRQWRRFGDWMFSHGLLKKLPQADIALTNEFLAGQGA